MIQNKLGTLPEPLAALVDHILSTARKTLEDGHKLAPLAFLVLPNAGQVQPLALDFSDSHLKQQSLHRIRSTASGEEANCVIFISEAWAKAGDAEELKHIREKVGGLSAKADEREVMLARVDTLKQRYVAYADITITGTARSFSDVEFRRVDENSGVRLLPRP
ncbi:hypothetical protein [Paraburkholderia sp. MM5482-R1]|uniref:hypothetical protein n=1 Tax=unclassified Paraburkholderia TaxID=2615204 RepID=UPI003D24F050